MTYEDMAREVGKEHGQAAASWVELDEQAAALVLDNGVFETLGDTPGPLSGEWADGYTVKRLVEDCLGSVTDEQLDDGYALDDETGQMVARFDDLADAYDEAYWQAYEAEVVRSARAQLPEDEDDFDAPDFHANCPDYCPWKGMQ